MRQLLRLLVLLSMVVTLVPLSAATTSAAQPEVVVDDELVIINRDDRIVVRDPYTPPGYMPLSWESPQTGFRQVYTGDFSGDGTAEIVGLRGGEAYVFDPYRISGEPDTARVFTVTSGQVWQIAATGRFWGGVRDGLALVQSVSGGGSITARLLVYSFQGSSWSQVYSLDLGATFQVLAAGDTDGDGADELVGTRSGTDYAQMLIFDPSLNWRTVYEVNYDWPWVALAVGDVQNAGETKSEIVTTRSGVPVDVASFLVLRYTGSSTELQDVYLEYTNPYFQKIALADVTGNLDKEIYLLRPGLVSGNPIVALTSRNPGGDPSQVIQFNELAGQNRFGNINAGDLDADNRDELVVMANNEYLIYTDPANSRAYQSYPGSYSTSLSFAVGNLDGVGISPGPQLAVSPASVSLSLQSGQTATRTVQITNSGTGTLNWTAVVTRGSSWLSVQPASGTAPSTATFQIDARNLTVVGSYNGVVQFTGPSGTANSPLDVPVTLTLTQSTQPQLVVTPSVINLTLERGQTATQNVAISSSLTALNWTASLTQGAPWLSFSPSSGTTPGTLVVAVDTADVEPAQYVGKVRVTASGAPNSPQDITVNLTVTAPPFYANPTTVSWAYVPPADPGTRTVTVFGTGISWHAGVVPMDQVQRVQAAIDGGLPMSIHDGVLTISDGGEDVPIVDYVDVAPSSSSSNQTSVTLSLVLDRVPSGFSPVAVVFVADGVATPQAVVVRASVLLPLPDASDLYFLPKIVSGQS